MKHKADGWGPANWSLSKRLAASFSLVILISIGLVTLAVQLFADTRLDEVAVLVNRRQAFRMAPFFADIYQQNESWRGVEQQVERFSTPLPPSLIKDARAYYPSRTNIFEALTQDRLVLADAVGRIVVDSSGQLSPNQPLPPDLQARAVPVVSQGQQIGQLIYTSQLEARISELFLTVLRRSLLSAGLVAGLGAIIVSIMLAYQLTQPIRRLNTATQHLAALGQPSDPIPVESRDEIGQLTHSFNQMAVALDHQKQLRKQMVADIAHELRTPLSVMQLELEGLQDGLQQPKLAAATLHEEVGNLNRLVEDLRTLSLADAGAIQFELKPLDLNLFLQQIVATWRTKMNQKQVELAADIAANLPQIQADRGRLAQVFNNLLSNTLHHTPAGKTVILGAQRGQKEVLLWVSDTGSGIDPANLPHIFERFYRTDQSRNRDTGGSGLGLAIARQWVLLHNGHIWAESEPGQGTQFYISLPILPIE